MSNQSKSLEHPKLTKLGRFREDVGLDIMPDGTIDTFWREELKVDKGSSPITPNKRGLSYGLDGAGGAAPFKQGCSQKG